MSYKLEHKFIYTALTSFTELMDRVFKEYENNFIDGKFPIQFINVGDDVYLSNYVDIGKDKKEFYKTTPRIDLSLGGVNIEPSELTNKYITARIGVRDSDNKLLLGQSHVRRVPLKIAVSSKIVFTKLHEYLSFVEYYLTVLAHNQITTEFEYEGLIQSMVVSNVWDYDSEANLTFDFGSDKKERVCNILFTLDLQFPSYLFYDVKGINYLEKPMAHIYTFDELCDSCKLNGGVDENCGTCGNKESMSGMNPIIHNVYVNDDKKPIQTTIIKK